LGFVEIIELWVGAHIMRLRAATWGRPYPVIEKSGRAGACPRRKFSQSQRQGQAPALQINKLTDKPQFAGVVRRGWPAVAPSPKKPRIFCMLWVKGRKLPPEVISIMKYSDLNDLLREDPRAKEYFNTLPEYVQSQIQDRPGGVNSFASLQDYAENLTRGDG